MLATTASRSTHRALLVLLLGAALTSLAFAQEKDKQGSPGPSDDARGMCGAMGTIELKPDDWIGNPKHPNPEGPTTWWVDTDGIDPDTPGCHLGLTAPVNGKLNGRLFGEACLDDGLLVESNPGAGEVHGHVNDLGHPDTFDCGMWCKGKGYSKGHCEAAPAFPCQKSAKCTCAGEPPASHGGGCCAPGRR